MNEEIMEQRLARIEERLGEVERRAAEDRAELKVIHECVHRIEVSVTQLTAKPSCPAPGLCMDLRKVVDEREPRIRKLEDYVLGLKTGAMALSGAASLFGAGLALLVNHFWK
jgi:hypothetical protein